jgi:hypothetical protein
MIMSQTLKYIVMYYIIFFLMTLKKTPGTRLYKNYKVTELEKALKNIGKD